MPPLAEGFASRFADANGQRIHYWIGGEGPPLVLIHGYPENGFAWHDVAPALARDHTVIVPDFRGAGESSKPDSGYTTGDLAEDIHQVVHGLGYPKVDLAGHDWGGSVAYAYAAAHREEVGRMANLEAGAPAGFGQEAAQQANPQTFWFVWLARQADAEAIVAGREREYLTPLYRDFSHVQGAVGDRELTGYVCSFSQPGAMHAGFMLYRDEATDAEQNKRSAQVKLTMPVLAVGGQYSLGDFSAAEQQVATNVRPVVIADAGHFVLSDNPAGVIRALSDFFRPQS